MTRTRELGWLLIVMVVCGLGSPLPLESQTTTIITNPTTACVDSIRKYYFPSGPTNPSLIAIIKFLTMADTCVTTMSNAANCIAMPSDLAATASGSEITMSPSCQWNCNACGTIVTSSTDDGLPIELMDFDVEGEISQRRESDAATAADGAGGGT